MNSNFLDSNPNNENSVLVSIITVCLNAADKVENTILSVLNQNYPNIEYIIIDGQSTDGTIDIIRKHESQIATWISELDTNLYQAINKGIGKANGDLIGILNAGDIYDKNAVEKMVEAYDPNTPSIYHANMTIIDHNSQEELFLVRPLCDLQSLYKSCCINHPTTFVDKRVYYQYGSFFFDKYSLAADHDFLLRTMKRGVPFIYLNQNITFMENGGLSEKKIFSIYWQSLKISTMHGGSFFSLMWGYGFAITKKIFRPIVERFTPQLLRYHRRASARTNIE